MTEPTLPLDLVTSWTPDPSPDHACAGAVCRYCHPSPTGPDARDRALAATGRDLAWWHAADEWLDGPDVCIGARFTADDLTRDIGLPTGSTNQVGARLRSWAMAGRIDPDGYTQASRKSSHARVLRVWRVAR